MNDADAASGEVVEWMSAAVVDVASVAAVHVAGDNCYYYDWVAAVVDEALLSY